MNSVHLRCLAIVLGLVAPLHVAAQGGGDKREAASLSTIIIYSPQMQKLAKFYEQALQLSAPATVFDNHIGYWLGSNYVGFEPAPAGITHPGGVSAWFGVADIDATYQRLLTLGAKENMKPAKQPWGDLHATVFDPDGNLMGLIQVAKRR